MPEYEFKLHHGTTGEEIPLDQAMCNQLHTECSDCEGRGESEFTFRTMRMSVRCAKGILSEMLKCNDLQPE